MREHLKSLCMGLAANKESVLKDAISHVLGNDWIISDLTGRGHFSIYPNYEEIFSFDGVDLIVFYPIKTEVVHGIGTEIKVSQNYRLLYSAEIGKAL